MRAPALQSTRSAFLYPLSSYHPSRSVQTRAQLCAAPENACACALLTLHVTLSMCAGPYLAVVPTAQI